MNWNALLTISAVALVGCGNHERRPDPVPPEPVTVPHYVVPDCGRPPARARINLCSISTAPTVIETTEDGETRQWFAFTPDEYACLADNISDVQAGVRELRAEIQYYVDCLAREREAAAAKNEENQP